MKKRKVVAIEDQKFKYKFKNIKPKVCPYCGNNYIPTAKSKKMCIPCLFRKIEELKSKKK